jgi:ABC-type multidrug transport system fused ATPase/permease subunit
MCEKYADQILVVNDGRIVEKGTHYYLIAQGGIYSWFIHIREKAENWAVC